MKTNINKLNNITIIGTGAWGTTIAKVLSESGNPVTMYGINKKEIQEINKHGMNKNYFGNRKINTIIRATDNIKEALSETKFIIFAIPSSFFEGVLTLLKKELNHKVIFINLVKGINPKTKMPWSATISKTLEKYSNGVVSLIGPSFAIDVFQKKPTIINIVSKNKNVINKVMDLFQVDYFRLIPCNDEIGSELIAAYKNLLAIGIGIVQESYKSINTVSSILAQGIKEIQEIVIEAGGKSNTILEYCGIGDIFLTCTSDLSRNFSFGKNIVQKGSVKNMKIKKVTVEGYTLYKVMNKHIVKNKKLVILPIICRILSGELEPKKIFFNCVDESNSK